MATMVKEKRRDKKKCKQKHIPEHVNLAESPSVANLPIHQEEQQFSEVKEMLDDESLQTSSLKEDHETELEPGIISGKDINVDTEGSSLAENMDLPIEIEAAKPVSDNNIVKAETSTQSLVNEHAYIDLNLKLERISIPAHPVSLTKERTMSIERESAYLKEVATEPVLEAAEVAGVEILEPVDIAPSAPMLDFSEPQIVYPEQVIIHEVPKLISMPLEEAIRMFGGKEMEEVMAMSEREEAIVEAGDMSGPDHPLVDFLSTFKRSLIAMERERTQLTVNLAEEEKYRTSLWKIEKRSIYESENCEKCGERIYFKATYDHAELQKDKLPVARMKLESILRDVRESFCHHQHAALLAYCQIEEFISETINSSKSEIRAALSLVLQALKRSDDAPAVLSSALRRWCAALAAALVDSRDLRQLLFLLQHLFRQTRSVRWAARVIDLPVTDDADAARAVALLDILLTRPRLESAVECTEDKDEEWEELCKDGGGGAVSDGALRERDMLALLRAFPLRELVARLGLLQHITESREWQWSDASGGREVLRACAGARALLGVLRRGGRAHAHYARLLRELRCLAVTALRALAAVHERNWQLYSKDLELKIQAELEASFVAGFEVLGPSEARHLPASLLSWHAARDYCVGHIDHLHDSGPHRVESLSLDIPAQTCAARVATVACAAADRTQDYDLARIVLEFLFQTGVRRNSASCAGACRRAARDALPQLLAAHPHLYAVALHLVAETSQVEKLDASAISCLAVDKWRPQSGEARAVADDWATRCPHLLPPLLLNLDCTPHTGLSLDTQLTIGSWLCSYAALCSPAGGAGGAGGAGVEEWLWAALRRLRVHRALWAGRAAAPPPESEPRNLFDKAYALMASSWGHSIPLICSEGVSALCSLAAARPADALHCLAPLMLLLVDSPESVASTDKFTEFFGLILNAGPSLVQRALGRAAPSGPELLTRLLREQLAGDGCGGVPHTALVRVWIWALWRPALPAAAAVLDSVLRPRHCWQLDEFTQHQHSEWEQQMSTAQRMSAQAPLICYGALRAWLAQRELSVALPPRLELALHAQRTAGQRIHVSNALKLIGSSTPADDLVIYRTAAAILVAPHAHIAHLLLWALFMHLYLQRPQCDKQDSTPPVGPLYFSGIIKSRTLAQLKRQLQVTIRYHQNEAQMLVAANPDPAPTPTTSKIVESESRTIDNPLLPLSITDLTCESSDSSESDGSDEERDETRSDSREDNDDTMKKNIKLTIAYHKAAENMLTTYATWLDEGERVTADQHKADISRFIPENFQEAACQVYSSGRRASTPTSDRVAAPLPPAPPPPDPTLYDRLISELKKIRKPRRKSTRRSAIKSPVDNVDFKDVRSLLNLVNTHMKDLQILAKETSAEVVCISKLNAALWKLVHELRVPRPLPLMQKSCASKCKPHTYAPPGREWCISVGAVQGVKENRAKALAYIRRMARPRPDIARTAAALLTIARRTRSSDAAKRVAELVLQGAAGFPSDTTSATLVAFLDLLAERWLCSDGLACAYLIRRAYSNSNAQALIGALVAPRRVPPAHVPALLTALLRGGCSPEEMFSYLSRFDMSRWADSVGPEARKETLDELTEAARRWAPRTEPEYQVLLELVAMQSAALCRETELCGFVTTCCRACVEGWLPPPHLPHATRAAARCAAALPCDQLGHLLREVGVIWWEARTGVKGSKHTRYSAYAPHVAGLLSALHRAFVAGAVRLSYAPERVGALAWSSLLESWSAWVVPHGAAPLLPSTGDEEYYTLMLQHFHETIQHVMADCPGTEEYLLSQMFEWAIQTFLGVHNSPNQENRVQVSALLAELAKAPWTQHQWLQASSVQALLQVCQLNEAELGAWCSAACARQAAETWLRQAPRGQPGALLPQLLLLFTAAVLQHGTILEEATRLPWQWLPEEALEEALERFFAQHYSLSVPYHDRPQFRMLLSAGELYYPPDRSVSVSVSESSRRKRGRVVSQWVRAACAPALAAHAHAHSRAVLAVLSAAAPHLAGSEGELEDLLSRALAIMCIEPAAAAALAVWEPWVRSACPLLGRARVRSVGALTAFEYYAPLADAAVRAYFNSDECPSWSSIAALWAEGHWRDAAPLCARARLHAAYGTLAAHAHDHARVRAALLALLAANIHFVENEAIVAVWICAAGRLVWGCSFEGAQGEARAAGGALLRRWAEPARRSLLQVVSLQPSTASPTPGHRLLALFALCVLSPNSESDARAFEAACAQGGAAGVGPDVGAWGRAPHPKRLPRLAARLYPNHEKYFKEELEMAPE